MPKTRRRIVFQTAKAFAVIFIATTVAMKSFDFPATAMRALQALQTFTMFGAIPLSILWAAMEVSARFARNSRRNVSG